MKPIKHKITDDHDEWLKQRNKGIGGSDTGAVMGLNPYKSAFTLWHEKTGQIRSFIPDNEAMRYGRDMEDYVAKRFCEATGKRVQRSGFSFQSAEHPFMLANIDRKIVGENAGLECKTANIFAEKIYDEGALPDTYYCQILHYMAVCDFDRMYLACYIPQRGLKTFCIERKDVEEDLQALIEAEKDFWQSVQTNQRPDPDGSEYTKKTIAELALSIDFDDSSLSGSESVADISEMEEVIEQIETIKQETKGLEASIKARKKIRDELENKLKLWLEDHQSEIAYTANKKVSWAEQIRTDVDKERLKVDHPGIYEEYATQKTIRTLRIGNIPKKERKNA